MNDLNGYECVKSGITYGWRTAVNLSLKKNL
jgi:hypothetical protein